MFAAVETFLIDVAGVRRETAQRLRAQFEAKAA
jgi:hypothetical protein